VCCCGEQLVQLVGGMFCVEQRVTDSSGTFVSRGKRATCMHACWCVCVCVCSCQCGHGEVCVHASLGPWHACTALPWQAFWCFVVLVLCEVYSLHPWRRVLNSSPLGYRLSRFVGAMLVGSCCCGVLLYHVDSADGRLFGCGLQGLSECGRSVYVLIISLLHMRGRASCLQAGAPPR
jgi:hypothetical protein